MFSAVQLLYFFGGSTLPQGMTYAEYARSGFFQMFAAAAIVFSAVALILKLLPERNLAVKVLLTVMTVAVLIMLASSTTSSSYVMSRGQGYDGALTANTILLTTFLSAFTLTGWLYVLRSMGLI